MGKSIKQLTMEAQRDNGWSWTFANAYVCARYIEGMSHLRAYQNAMSNPFVYENEKPRAW